MFRRFAIASTLLIAGSVLAAPAMADTVNIGGTVTNTTAVTSTATAGASTLSLYGGGTAQDNVVVKVADMALITNNTTGVTLTATAAGSLSNGTSSLAYKVLIVGNEATAPADTAFTANTNSQTVNDFSSGASARDLYIEYDVPALLDPGAYTSTITVSVASL